MTEQPTARINPSAAPASPIADVGAVLQQYFAGRTVGVASDANTRLIEGFLVAVQSKMWGGRVKLLPEDLGLAAADYHELANALRWGSVSLLDDDIRRELMSLNSQARKLPIHWGRRTYWGRYVPLSAMGAFKTAFGTFETAWQQTIQTWIGDYERYFAEAEARVAALAERAAAVAETMGHGGLINQTEMIDRLLADYPSPDEIGTYTLTYSVTFIPTPRLQAEQAAQLEVIEKAKLEQLAEQRRQAEARHYEHERAKAQALSEIDLATARQQQQMAVLAEERTRLESDLARERQKLLDDFYRGYAVDIRQRLHEALMFVTEGVRGGKITPAAGRSLRTVLDEIQHLALDDDREIQQMRERLQQILGEPGKGRVDAGAVQQDIEDLGMLLQTSIIALGEQPRMPRRGGVEVRPQDVLAELPADPTAFRSEVRAARQRSGLDTSLAETLVEAASDDTLRRQRRRGGADLAPREDGRR